MGGDQLAVLHEDALRHRERARGRRLGEHPAGAEHVGGLRVDQHTSQPGRIADEAHPVRGGADEQLHEDREPPPCAQLGGPGEDGSLPARDRLRGRRAAPLPCCGEGPEPYRRPRIASRPSVTSWT